ncbi:hypothetical protein FACS189434_04170 [Bacteroidia bacterium]|nr:hypothetical protein FACS189434_04170 [Bacteroidia bacterium]
MLKKNGNIEKTTIFAPGYERVTYVNGAISTTKHFYYISGGDGLAAIGINEEGQPTKVYYAHTDHLGSIVKLTDNNGSVVFAATYDAWGKQSITNNTLAFHRGYTGHEMLPEFGLINMNGRMYDPILGRMLSPDKYVANPFYSQDYNRYSYARNNPLSYTDPSGNALFGVINNFLTDFFLTTFVHGGLDFSSKGAMRDAWKDFDPSAAWSKTNKSWEINAGLWQTDPNKGGWARFGEFLSRFTWQAPQTAIGYGISSVQNYFGGVKSVTHYGGATAVEAYKGDWGAFTLSSFVYGQRGLQANPDNSLFQHEYGHYLQSQKAGPTYFMKYAYPSIISAATDEKLGNNHNYFFSEQDANVRAFKYFSKNVEGFNDPGDNNAYSNGRWWYSSNPIIGYNWSKPYDDPSNQLALSKNIFSSNFLDYLSLGGTGVIVGYLQMLFGYGK